MNLVNDSAAVAPPGVVFVCEHGAAKSVLAVALFQEAARAHGLTMRAACRGTDPDAAISDAVSAGLRADNLTPGISAPVKLERADLEGARVVVTFDRPEVAATLPDVPVEAWDGLPLVSEDYAAARDAIRARVHRLVDSLARHA